MYQRQHQDRVPEARSVGYRASVRRGAMHLERGVATPSSHNGKARFFASLRGLRTANSRMKEMLKLSRSPVVVAFDKVDCSAGQPLSIGNYAFRSSQAEIPEKIKNIAWLGASVNTLADHIVHLLRIRKRAIALPNDVEVAEMKIGREPDIAHGFLLVDLGAQRHRL